MKKQDIVRSFFLYFGKTILILFLSTLISIALDQFGMQSANIIMIYLIGVLLIIIETKGYAWGMVSSVACICCINFFFTEPRFTLRVTDKDNVLMLFLFLIVCFISGTLMSKLQKHADEAVANEQHAQILYQTSSGYLNISGMENILRYAAKSLPEVQSRETIIYLAKNLAELEEPYYLEPKTSAVEEALKEKAAAQWCLSNLLPCGVGTSFFVTSGWKYLPVKSKTTILGVIGFYCGLTDIDENEMTFINALLSQLALAIEREKLDSRQKETRIQVEKAELKNNLLRSISHDLRTPLTGIAGSGSFLIESFDRLDKETILKLLRDICSDATWLNNLVENLLSMTRIQDNKLQIKKENEVVDDIIAETASRVERILKNHQLSFDIPEEILAVPMDGRLIVQVLVNLVDNAVNHTKENADICIRVSKEGETAAFEVEDNGGGIDAEMLPEIFEGFVTAHANGSDAHRGIGLGLSICKSIIEAHKGTITAYNNTLGGATFRFILPM
ncbi:MAG: DUF4118 domain-containing protein [Eubacteriales bacterium]|nr:DUF4118 domain-containing protein [Eubacteriales bacterium]